MLFLEGLVGLRRTQLQVFRVTGWGIGLDYHDTEWFALETSRGHSVVLRLHPSTAFWLFVDSDGYSISSRGFLPTVVGIMVI